MHVRTFYADLNPFPPAILAEAAALSGPTCMGKTEVHINETLYFIEQMRRPLTEAEGTELFLKFFPGYKAFAIFFGVDCERHQITRERATEYLADYATRPLDTHNIHEHPDAAANNTDQLWECGQ